MGGDWNTYTHLVGGGDANRDGRPDLYADNAANSHGVYPSKGTGDRRVPFRSREQVGVYFAGTKRR
ncbi:hypothetical protein [Streptomyces altiplanensis]